MRFQISRARSYALFAVGIGILGAGALLLTHAATPSISKEAESGSFSNPSLSLSDSTASGNAAVRFGIRYYVSPSGNDTASGQSGAPWKTLQHAADTAPAGATIILASGTYSPATLSRPNLTFTGAGAATVIAAAAGVRDGININASNVAVSNLTVSGCIPNASPGSFEDNGSSGIRINDSTTSVVIDGVTITNSDTTRNGDGLPFGCFGIMVHNANHWTIQNSTLTHNGYGIFVMGGGQSSLIKNNQIHDNDVIIRNTTANTDDDFGAVAIGFDNTTLSPSVTATGNNIYNNVGPSNDYTTDGGGFEIFDASNLTMTANTIANNENILETGTYLGGSNCQNNTFSNNTASGKSAGSALARSVGVILRCAQNMTVDNNTLTGLDWWAFDITGGGTFGGSIQGLKITNNTVNQTGYDKVYAMEVNPSGQGLNLGGNKFHEPGSIFATGWVNNTPNYATLTAWQAATGLDTTSSTY